ncbi:helix-turn-helix domain-containing protein [Clostridium sp. JN-1]|uniref:helix-turn-helix domain-containing protein n=1 Tax=Clostridium sp. JN-1 TaxID=2483110 RepID=UPI000F0B4417|nr:helix-turn-helix domain-containing protein [Clostridium sp. JN-1]
MDNEILYTVDEVAMKLKTNKNMVYDLIRRGYISALKLGRLKVTKFELLRFAKWAQGKDFTNLDNVKDLTFQKKEA